MNRTTDTKATARGCGLSSPAIAWVREHGSEYLRSCVEKGYFCHRRYNEERARLEAPGWSLLIEAAYQPLNPPAEAVGLLARAREQFPQASLRQIFKHDHVEFVIVVDAPWPDGYRLLFNDRVYFYVDF